MDCIEKRQVLHGSVCKRMKMLDLLNKTCYNTTYECNLPDSVVQRIAFPVYINITDRFYGGIPHD